MVAIGGAFGATARFLINLSPLSAMFGKFPFHTFLINVSGSFFIGFLLVIFTDKYTENENLQSALTVGFLGAFTTFSTFELEIFELIRERFFVTAFAYLLLSVLVGFVGVTAGIWLAKKF
jgi:CrcB protein